MPDRDDRTAVVTGGARGIGRAIAERLASEGAHVVVVDIRDGTDTVEAIEGAGNSAEFREGDVTSESSMRDAFEGLDLDVLVNNAAVYSDLVEDKKRFDEIDVAEWDRVFAVNVKGVFVASKEALPHFDDGGHIVNIASAVVSTGLGGFLHYVGSKAAVVGMTRAMANELGDEDIRVNAVKPGLTMSEAGMQTDDERIDTLVENQAIGRPIRPEDIAKVVAFLAGPDSDMVTGQTLNVSGGFVHD